MEKFFSFFLEIFLKSACGKFTAILEQNLKVNIDQHASKIMWFYGLRKITFGRCLLKANNQYNFYLYSIFTFFLKIMEDGRPWLDMAHVTACLNKLDAGVSEKVCLMSRDEQNVLVVSYSELRQCLDQSFSECIHSHRNSNVPSSVASATMGGYNWWWIVKTWDFFVKFHENDFTWFSQERTTVFILFFLKKYTVLFWACIPLTHISFRE